MDWDTPPLPELHGALWNLTLDLAGRTASTRNLYRTALAAFGRHAQEHHDMPLDPSTLGRTDVERWILHLRDEGRSAATIATYTAAVRAWFTWMTAEGHYPAHPLAQLPTPAVPLPPTPVLPEDALRALLHTCEGRSWQDRRDLAIIRLLLDTGMRRGELASLTVEGYKQYRTARQIHLTHTKNGQPRLVQYGKRTALALERYLMERSKHPLALLPDLFLGRTRALGGNGVYRVVKTRAAQAGLGHAWPHQLRHVFAHGWLAAGGQEGDLMRLAGWKSRRQLDRYGASAAQERAVEAHRRLQIGDRF